ncbi:MAG: TonB-dependent receptor [Bacteroidales bacterium]|jgi:TonB-linked SusC/RagA family outer membrane protein|nr:TonB-dependent receptor [Bacteroidales bacterium]
MTKIEYLLKMDIWRRALVLLCILSCYTLSVLAQQRVNGTVVDVASEPILGVTVLETGTNNGTVTDANGKFSLTVAENAALTVSFIGYETQIISELNGNQPLVVTLSEDTRALEEIVVVGYGTMRKKDLTGAVSVVDGATLQKIHATSVQQALQGSMAGVQITRSSGLPGAGATIRVRGITTIGTSDPLLIVDGVRGYWGDLNTNEIESITVLKDGASAAIYGSAAAAGVVLITTKRAKTGELSLSYEGVAGVIMPVRFPKTVSPTRYMEMMNEIQWNDAGNITGQEYGIFAKDYIDNYLDNNKLYPDQYPLTDWIDLLVADYAPRTEHNLTLTYGNEVIKSKFTLNYQKENALYHGRSYEPVHFRANNDLKINDYLSASVDVNYIYLINKNAVANPLEQAYEYGPIYAAKWSDGRIGPGREGINMYARIQQGGFENTWGQRFTGKVALKFTPLKDLVISAVVTPMLQASKVKRFVREIPVYAADDPSLLINHVSGHTTTSLEESRGDSKSMTKQFLINYNKQLGKVHNISAMLGYEDYYAFSESLGATADRFTLPDYPYLSVAPPDYKTSSGSASENATTSFFGRLTYNFADKYLFQANIRHDGSSKFHKDYRWGVFPSFSAGWVITEEKFMKTSGFKPLSFFKIKGSWGNLGNDRSLGNYPYEALMGFGNALMYEGNAVITNPTAAQGSLAMREITWETTESWDFGFESRFFNNRLSLNADYYTKITHDMLLALEVPDLIGYGNPSQNAGVMNTKGWEVTAGWNDNIGDFSYGFEVNISDYRSVMGNLSGIVFDGAQIIREDSEYNEWYGYKSSGFYMNDHDLALSPTIGAATAVGDIKYLDISGPDGVPDGVVNPDYDRVLLGGSLPRYIYGGNLNLGWKGIDMSISFNGVGKQTCKLTPEMVYRTNAAYTFPAIIDGHYFSKYNTDEQNSAAQYPRLSQTGYNVNNYVSSDFWLFNGGYFRLKNITLGYTLPKKATESIHLQHVRFYVSASDIFSIDHYPQGWDPEAAINSYIARSFNFGLNIKF